MRSFVGKECTDETLTISLVSHRVRILTRPQGDQRVVLIARLPRSKPLQKLHQSRWAKITPTTKQVRKVCVFQTQQPFVFRKTVNSFHDSKPLRSEGRVAQRLKEELK